MFGDFSVMYKVETPFAFRTNFHKYEHFVESNLRKKEKNFVNKSVDERTLRFKNGKQTRATVLMCVQNETIKNLRGCWPRSFIDFRIRAFQRFENYAENADTSKINSVCRTRIQEAFE